MAGTLKSALGRAFASRRRAIVVVVLLAAIGVLTALTVRDLRNATSSMPATGSGHSRVSGRVSGPARSAATPTGNPLLAPPDLSKFPEVDTPIEKAPHELQLIWGNYDVSIIPSRHIFDSIPTAPRIRNLTNGAVSEAEAQAWVEAEYRSNAYIGWLEAHDQGGFNHHIRDDSFLAGPVASALRADEPITDPLCDLYAAKAALVPVDDSIRAFLALRGGGTSPNKYALVETYRGPCVVTATTPTGTRVLDSVQGPETVIEIGNLRHDPLLGDIWFADDAGQCRAGAMPAACEAVS